jgi:hypothetical protein
VEDPRWQQEKWQRSLPSKAAHDRIAALTLSMRKRRRTLPQLWSTKLIFLLGVVGGQKWKNFQEAQDIRLKCARASLVP